MEQTTENKIVNREQRKKIMISAGISACGVGLTLFLAASNIMDIEFTSAVSVGILTAIVGSLYTIIKGKK